MSKIQNGTRIIGHVWVDSGQMMLGDPCYLSDWQGQTVAFDRPGEYSYAGACTATTSNELAGIIGTDQRGSAEGMAAVFSTGYGDGTYPVEVTYRDGRVMSVTIVFDQEDDQTPVDECCEECGGEADYTDGLCYDCHTGREREEEAFRMDDLNEEEMA